MADETQAKVDRAVEELEAEGVPVTSRAVRERAGVRMSVAAEAARAWNERQQAVDVPEVPDVVVTRMEGIWREAVQQARAELSAEREGLRQQAQAAHDEVEAYRAEVHSLEVTRDQQAAQLREFQEEAARERESEQKLLEELRRRADRAEAKAEAVTDERDRLLAERDSLRKEHDSLRGEYERFLSESADKDQSGPNTTEDA